MRQEELVTPHLPIWMLQCPEPWRVAIRMTTETPKPAPLLPTPLLADACVRLGISLRLAPAGLAPVVSGSRVLGAVLPVRHAGSVDVFLEALASARPGDILVIDNAGRCDEGCIGDLTA